MPLVSSDESSALRNLPDPTTYARLIQRQIERDITAGRGLGALSAAKKVAAPKPLKLPKVKAQPRAKVSVSVATLPAPGKMPSGAMPLPPIPGGAAPLTAPAPVAAGLVPAALQRKLEQAKIAAQQKAEREAAALQKKQEVAAREQAAREKRQQEAAQRKAAEAQKQAEQKQKQEAIKSVRQEIKDIRNEPVVLPAAAQPVAAPVPGALPAPAGTTAPAAAVPAEGDVPPMEAVPSAMPLAEEGVPLMPEPAPEAQYIPSGPAVEEMPVDFAAEESFTDATMIEPMSVESESIEGPPVAVEELPPDQSAEGEFAE